ncbi:amino acid transporter [Paenibacillus harenae]|nr:amino acid transporter [Paenibacillus harenae]
MWSAAAVLAVGILIIVVEAPSLKKENKRKELWAFSVLLFAGSVLCIAVSMGVRVPSPLEGIKLIYEPISKSLLGK